MLLVAGPLPIHIFVQEITTALELSDPKIREWVPPGYSCLACFRVGNPVDSHGQQTAGALEGARNLVSHPTVLPSVGAKQDACHARLINRVADGPLDLSFSERVGFLRTHAVQAIQHHVRMASPPPLIHRIDSALVLVVTKRKESSRTRRSFRGRLDS